MHTLFMHNDNDMIVAMTQYFLFRHTCSYDHALYYYYPGATHYVYPGANHTRFEHSIGWVI